MNPTEPVESDAVDHAFDGLRALVAHDVVTPPLTEITARGRRRRRGYVAVAGLAVVAVIAGGYGIVNERAPVPAPAPAAPGVSPGTPTGSRQEDRTRIPAGFLLHERESEPIDDFDYADACFGQPRARRSAARSVGEVRVIQSLFAYDTAPAAEQVMANLRAELVSCSGYGGGTVLQAPNDPGWGDEAAAVRIAKEADGAGEHTGATVRFVAVRVGAAIATFEGYPEVPEIDADAYAIVARLCFYDPACTPNSELPATLPGLTMGGEAWAAVLGTYPNNDPKALPGETIAAAAELGYHATTVPSRCDQGATEAVDDAAEHTAVYFSSASDAQKFAAALPAVAVKVVKVRTFCR